MRSTLKIQARNPQLTLIGEMPTFARAVVIPRFNDVGRWLVEVPRDDAVTQTLDYGFGLVFSENNVALRSGPIDTIEKSFKGGAKTLVLAGPDDMTVLADNPAYPAAPVYGSGSVSYASAYDTRIGTRSTIMREYVEANIAGGAYSTGRTVPGLILGTDPAIGGSVTEKARFQSLLEILQRLALPVGLGFDVVQSGTSLVFSIYQPTDRSTTAVFSTDPRIGNVSDYTHEEKRPAATYIRVAGSGTGSSRVFVEGGDPAWLARYGRLEAFVDRRDTAVVAELQKTLDEKILELGPQISLQFSPIDTAQLKFGEHYYLGDKVTFRDQGIELSDLVREVELSWAASAPKSVKPLVGTDSALAPNQSTLLRKQRAEERKTSNLERQ